MLGFPRVANVDARSQYTPKNHCPYRDPTLSLISQTSHLEILVHATSRFKHDDKKSDIFITSRIMIFYDVIPARQSLRTATVTVK